MNSKSTKLIGVLMVVGLFFNGAVVSMVAFKNAPLFGAAERAPAATSESLNSADNTNIPNSPGMSDPAVVTVADFHSAKTKNTIPMTVTHLASLAAGTSENCTWDDLGDPRTQTLDQLTTALKGHSFAFATTVNDGEGNFVVHVFAMKNR